MDQLIRAVDEHRLRIDLPKPTDPKMMLYTLATSVSAVVLDRREHLIGVATSLEQRVENRLVVAIDRLPV